MEFIMIIKETNKILLVKFKVLKLLKKIWIYNKVKVMTNSKLLITLKK
jgi:hypothetical protein